MPILTSPLQESPVIQQLVLEEGSGYWAICRELEHAGILSSRGKKTWHTSNIVNLCANTTCIGGTAGLARPGRTARSRRSPRPTASSPLPRLASSRTPSGSPCKR
ncbi:MAG: hypothetical protein DMD99_03765 [Candidatus Rokuibacteriota bacterium]|nr:MAG: hypothetical protein DMD99_03765 [Candidatus Rokubacteria bacterium]